MPTDVLRVVSAMAELMNVKMYTEILDRDANDAGGVVVDVLVIAIVVVSIDDLYVNHCEV
jgi:hypothetical protein